MPTPIIPIEQRIAAKTKSHGECLVWTGSKLPHGYGTIFYKGHVHRAHRLVYELAHGEIPIGLVICHKCDNPSCVRLAHLELGTQRKNIEDMWAKGRANIVKGMSNGRAKLTECQVADIRARYRRYDRSASTRALAREFNVSHAVISSIIRGESWKDAS